MLSKHLLLDPHMRASLLELQLLQRAFRTTLRSRVELRAQDNWAINMASAKQTMQNRGSYEGIFISPFRLSLSATRSAIL